MKKRILMLPFCLLAMLLPLQSGAAGDAKKGADTFAEECGDCHSIVSGKNKKGPTLHGIFGRKAATVGEFAGYSDTMKQSGIVWDAEKIDAYITKPKKVIPGGKMKYEGLADAGARADIIAYLTSVK
ncbi:MAG: c-type cytochrome [Burkholderiaceae bacterium]|nr:c-type cytochrome [Burkholderiaceae bacterium]